MKIIDHTPFFSPDGKINMIQQTRANMKMGAAWVQETQAQVGVIAVLNRELDKRYTLLRNVTLKGLEISIPMILVGPAGIYTLYVTPLRGMYRAKGELWGTLSGENFSPAATNLLTRTNRMARAVQVYLERQGYQGLGIVDSALLCSDPGMHVESVRPIVRVVQSDALERYAASISQARTSLSAEAVAEIANRILTPRSPQEEKPAALVPPPQESKEPDLYIPAAFADPTPAVEPEKPGELVFEFKPDDEDEEPSPAAPIQAVAPAAAQPRTPAQKPSPARRPGKRMSGRQWALLAVIGVIECLLLAVFIYLIYRGM